ncbi:ABC transporter permease [Gaiella sp.]|uniref:ABC transporter permease n=1 Tax=Gaiella sp. TaxID=2663207 RepID=UPI002E33C45C|nr:ABC transporter permease [Gaiella sp.]HEX5584302.1 ABC transporter permease [Gaiella sp.]
MTAIFALTVRQLTESRRLWLVVALVALPPLAGVAFRVGDPTTTDPDFADDVTATLVASATLPLSLLLFATSAFGNELSDRTLGFLALRPIARWQIVAGKLVAALVVGGVPVALSGALAVAIVGTGGVGGAAATGIGLLAGAAAYAAIFTWAGLATRHALLLGLVYVFVWEATLAAYLDGVRFLSVRRYTLGLIHGLDGDRLESVEHLLGGAAGLLGAAVVTVAFALLAVRKLDRMDVP